MVRRLPFQNNHGGGIVTGMGEREVQLFYAEGVGLFPSLSGQNELGLAGGQRAHGHVTGAYAFSEAGGRSQVDAVPPDGYTWKKWRDSVSESCCAATAPGVPSVLF